MSVEKFLNFFINQNIVLIESLTLLIVLFAAYLAYRSFVVAKNDELSPQGAGGDLSKMEEMIKKLLEQANKVPASATSKSADGTTVGSADNQQLLDEIETIKKELALKAEELEKARTSAASAGASATAAPGMTADEKALLEAKLKDLEGKLKEYEIISEDIADLSFYKEENANLKKQLESVKGSESPKVETPATGKISISVSEEATPPATTAAADATDLLAAAVAAAPSEPAPTAAPAVAPVAAEAAPAPVAEVAPSPETAVPVSAPAATPAAVTAAQPALPEKTGQVDEDILSEFNQALEEAQKAEGGEPPSTPTAAATSDSPESASFDIDKMVAEATDLKVPEGESVENSLDKEIDPDKLAAEAGGMENVSDDDKKLMGQFENFVKKEK